MFILFCLCKLVPNVDLIDRPGAQKDINTYFRNFLYLKNLAPPPWLKSCARPCTECLCLNVDSDIVICWEGFINTINVHTKNHLCTLKTLIVSAINH